MRGEHLLLLCQSAGTVSFGSFVILFTVRVRCYLTIKMASKRANGTKGSDKLVTLIQDDDGSAKNSKEIARLISKANVNKRVDGVSLVLFYLNNCRHLDICVLEVFVHSGCRLNVQDVHGRTPLHWLVGHKLDVMLKDHELDIERVVSLVELFLSKGADPCLVDNDGNNVLMVAILHHQFHLLKPLTEDKKLTKKLLDTSNKMGFNVLSLCFQLRINISDLIPDKFVNFTVQLNKTDDHGNNVLHSMFLNSLEDYQPTVKYTKSLRNTAKNGCKRIRMENNFEANLKYLIESGTNVSQRNSDGLVPLQSALLSLDNQRQLEPRYLESLIPPKAILAELVP